LAQARGPLRSALAASASGTTSPAPGRPRDRRWPPVDLGCKGQRRAVAVTCRLPPWRGTGWTATPWWHPSAARSPSGRFPLRAARWQQVDDE